jgi:hypothetical protein
MRLKTEIFVSALVRRVFSAGGFAAVERKGADAAGAIFIRQRFRDGRENLYGPAPQSFFEEDEAMGRLFEKRLVLAEAADVDALLKRESSFDSDLWIVELECDSVEGLLEVEG